MSEVFSFVDAMQDKNKKLHAVVYGKCMDACGGDLMQCEQGCDSKSQHNI